VCFEHDHAALLDNSLPAGLMRLFAEYSIWAQGFGDHIWQWHDILGQQAGG
jgi:hypothetical protein